MDFTLCTAPAWYRDCIWYTSYNLQPNIQLDPMVMNNLLLQKKQYIQQ